MANDTAKDAEPGAKADVGGLGQASNDGSVEKAASAEPSDAEKEADPIAPPDASPESLRWTSDGEVTNPLLRYAFLLVWFVILPAAFALFLVARVGPASGVEVTGPFAFIQNFLRDQPVPSVIGLFVLGETALWMTRHRLPFSRFAYPSLPAGARTALRPYFERARALLDEYTILLRTRAKDAPKEKKQRARTAAFALRDSMQHTPFNEEEFLRAVEQADEVLDTALGDYRKSEGREYLESIVFAVAIALFLRTSVFEAFKIPSGSMIPTLQVGDHIFVNKLSYGPVIPWTEKRVLSSMPPDRGDVMVFQFPERMEQDFIKRVIALPGDTLESKYGHPVINGWEVPSCFVGTYTYLDQDPTAARFDSGKHEGDLFVEFMGDRAYLTFYDSQHSLMPDAQGPYHVKEGEVWVMGDNRHNSHDSRFWFNGLGGGVPFANIKGRALFVWLSYANGSMDWSRFGAPVMGRPRVPPQLKHLEPGVAKCLRERPAVTMPPASMSSARGGK
jgi:signal peptidase I